jgi:hypothetical protein
VKRLFSLESRFVDAFLAGIIELEELKERWAKMTERRRALRVQYEQRVQL